MRYIGVVARRRSRMKFGWGSNGTARTRKHEAAAWTRLNLHRYLSACNGAGSFVKGNKVGGGISFMQAIQSGMLIRTLLLYKGERPYSSWCLCDHQGQCQAYRVLQVAMAADQCY